MPNRNKPFETILEVWKTLTVLKDGNITTRRNPGDVRREEAVDGRGEKKTWEKSGEPAKESGQSREVESIIGRGNNSCRVVVASENKKNITVPKLRYDTCSVHLE